MKEEKLTIITAVVSDEEKSIYVRGTVSGGKTVAIPIPLEFWGKVPEDKNPNIELQRIANILNGYQEDENGNWILRENFKPITITIKSE